MISLGDGKRSDRIFRGSETEAHAELAALLIHHGLHTDVPAATLTVSQLIERWVAKRSPSWAAVRAATLARWATTMKADSLGRMPANKVTVDHVEMWLTRMADGRERTTVKTYYSHLRTAFEWGVGRGLVQANPVTLAEMPELPERKERRWLSLDEARRLLDVCATDEWGPLFVTSAMLGLRPGEAVGITRSAVDLAAETVTINRALKRTSVVIGLGTIKNRKSRVIAAPPELLDALRRQIAAIDMARDVYGDEWPTEMGDLLFVHQSNRTNARVGRTPGETHIRRHLCRLCRTAGVPELVPYELRHACASILLHRGVTPADVAEMLGTSVQMLRLHYGHLLDPVQRQAVKVWSDLS